MVDQAQFCFVINQLCKNNTQKLLLPPPPLEKRQKYVLFNIKTPTFSCVIVFSMWNSNPGLTSLQFFALSFSRARASSSKRLLCCTCASATSIPYGTPDLQFNVKSVSVQYLAIYTFIFRLLQSRTTEIQSKIPWVFHSNLPLLGICGCLVIPVLTMNAVIFSSTCPQPKSLVVSEAAVGRKCCHSACKRGQLKSFK